MSSRAKCSRIIVDLSDLYVLSNKNAAEESTFSRCNFHFVMHLPQAFAYGMVHCNPCNPLHVPQSLQLQNAYLFEASNFNNQFCYSN